MLAYTTLSDWLYVPSAFEAAVYFSGFVVVLTLPTLVFGILDSRAAKASDKIKSSEPSLR